MRDDDTSDFTPAPLPDPEPNPEQAIRNKLVQDTHDILALMVNSPGYFLKSPARSLRVIEHLAKNQRGLLRLLAQEPDGAEEDLEEDDYGIPFRRRPRAVAVQANNEGNLQHGALGLLDQVSNAQRLQFAMSSLHRAEQMQRPTLVAYFEEQIRLLTGGAAIPEPILPPSEGDNTNTEVDAEVTSWLPNGEDGFGSSPHGPAISASSASGIIRHP